MLLIISTVLEPGPFLDENEWPCKITRVGSSFDVDGTETESVSEGISAQKICLLTVSNNFKPLFTLSTWLEQKTETCRVTLPIVLSSAFDCGAFSLRVVDGGKFIELTVKWPVPLSGLLLIHQKFLNSTETSYQIHHPEFIGFQENWKSFRSKASDWTESDAHISLKFPVETHIYKRHNLAWREISMRLLYVRLKETVDK